MSGLLRGKFGALAAFLGISALVAGGLGWATREALRLEEAQRVAAAQADEADRLRQQQAERTDKIDRALWRLDSRVSPALAREDSRPYAHYAALHCPFLALTSNGTASPPGQVYLPSPLLTADLPEWMALHFQLDKVNGWMSPQVIPESIQRMLRKQPIELALNNVTPERQKLLERLKKEYPWSGVVVTLKERGIAVDDRNNALALVEQQLNNSAGPPASLPGQPNNPDATNTAPTPSQVNGSNPGAPSVNNTSNPNSAQQLPGLQNNELQEFNMRTRVNWRGARDGQGAYQSDGRTYFHLSGAYPNKTVVLTDQPVEVELGSMRPIWLPNAEAPEHLLMVRATQVGSQPVYQGIVLDWTRLQDILKLEINDLFPEAKLVSIPSSDLAHGDRAMSALPVQLDPAEPPLPDQPRTVTPDDLPPIGWSPLRTGLLFAWAAAVIALLVVGLGGWSLIDLSERRIRFVSAVTHELRTPLTTLRLYLDLLTSGMVTEAHQRDDYLKTMHGETDRLNRLIGNVLDFARLEKQRPNVEKRTVAVADLLEQVRQTWAERCAASGKDLVTANVLPADTSVCTDPSLVEQIVGNLVDNARKYSRDASDARIWLRALRDNGRVVIEVEDRGPGVTKSDRCSIFRPFRRGHDADSKAGGVGLGLALATRWAAFIGARLTVGAGADNVGACFRLEL